MLVAVIVSCLVIPTSAADLFNNKEIYMKIDGIDGDSKDSAHINWIELLDFSHGSVRAVQNGDSVTSGRGVFEPITIRHIVDKSTPKFQEACMKGSTVSTGQIDYCRTIASVQSVVYSIKLEGIKFVSAHVDVVEMDDEGFQVVETVQLLVNKMTWGTMSVAMDSGCVGGAEATYGPSEQTTVFDDWATLTAVILGIVSFCLAIALAVVLIKNKKPAKAVDADDTGLGDERNV